MPTIGSVPPSLEELPTALLGAYKEQGLHCDGIAEPLTRYWSEGGEIAEPLWSLLQTHAINLGDSSAYVDWLPDLSSLLRLPSLETADRTAYHERLVALCAPLLSIADLLRLRDLRDDPWRERRVSSTGDFDAWLIAQEHPYTRDPEERFDPSFPAPATLPDLQAEIRAFISNSRDEFAGMDAALQAFDVHQAIRPALDAYDLHRWLRWMGVFIVDRWATRGLFDPIGWWATFFEPSFLPLCSIRDAISIKASCPLSLHVDRIAHRLAEDRPALEQLVATLSNEGLDRLLATPDAPWHTAPAHWLDLAEQTLKRDKLPGGDNDPVAAADMYQRLRPLLESTSDPQIALKLATYMAHPGLEQQDVLAMVNYCIELGTRHQVVADARGYSLLLKHIDAVDPLLELLSHKQDGVRAAVLQRYSELKSERVGAATPWPEIHDLARQHPSVICRFAPRTTTVDIDLWRILWASESEGCHDWVVDGVLCALDRLTSADEHAAQLVDYCIELADEAPKRLGKALRARYAEGYGMAITAIAMLAERRHAALEASLLAVLARSACSDEDAYCGLARSLIDAKPDDLAKVKPNDLGALLPCLDEAVLLKAVPRLLRILSKGLPQGLKSGLVELLTRFDVDLLERLGWLDIKSKNVRALCIDVLIAQPDSTALDKLRDLYLTGGLDQTNKDRIAIHLEANGIHLGDAADQSLAAITALAERLERVHLTVEEVFNDELAARLPELKPAVVRWMLHKVATDLGEGIPRAVAFVLDHCSRDNRVAFISALIERWIAADGDARLRWVLRLIDRGGDDGQVGGLVRAIADWSDNRKPLAVQALYVLAKIDTDYALYELRQIQKDAGYAGPLADAAGRVLEEATARRGIAPDALDDVLVPDFGLGEGVALDVGPYTYRVGLANDLGLRVTSPRGRITKSLPKAKEGEDPTKREIAEATFKRLPKDIKIVADRQSARIQAALLGARRWAYPQWQRLFAVHPLLSHLIGGLIWSLRDIDNRTIATFRQNGDGTFVDHAGHSIVPARTDRIALWHPIESDRETREAWQRQIERQGLEPIVEQARLPVMRLEPRWIDGPSIIAYRGSTLPQSQFRAQLEGWGYRPKPRAGGGGLAAHVLAIPELALNVEMRHTRLDADPDEESEVALAELVLHSAEQSPTRRVTVIGPGDLPETTQSVLLGQLEALAQLGQCNRRIA